MLRCEVVETISVIRKMIHLKKDCAKLEDFRLSFESRTSNGVMVSIDPTQYTVHTTPSDVRIDGSASVLRSDASWRLWTDHGKVFKGYAWPPGSVPSCLACAAPVDAKTVWRTTTFMGHYNRCGETIGVQWYQMIPIASIVSLFAIYEHAACNGTRFAVTARKRSAMAICCGLFVFWLAVYYDAPTWFGSMQRCEKGTPDCIKRTLRLQQKIYQPGVPIPNAEHAAFTAIAVLLSYLMLGCITKQNLDEKLIASVTSGAATLLLLQVVNSRTLAPFRRYSLQNEFVLFPRAGPSGIPLRVARVTQPSSMPSYLAIVTFDGFNPNRAKRALQAYMRLFAPNTRILHIHYRRKDTKPQFRTLCYLKHAIKVLKL